MDKFHKWLLDYNNFDNLITILSKISFYSFNFNDFILVIQL